MCNGLITTHSCGHEITDTVPCEAKLNDPDHECSPTEPIHDEAPQVCTSCRANRADQDEEEELAEALRRIETDASLAPITPSGGIQLVQAKSREYYPHCGHYARVILLDFEIDPTHGEFLDEEIRGSCPGCSIANPKTIEKMKKDGKWGPDPWGEMAKPVLTYEEALAEGASIGPSIAQQNYGFSSAGGYKAPDIFGTAGASGSANACPVVCAGHSDGRAPYDGARVLTGGRNGTQYDEEPENTVHGKGKAPVYDSDPEEDSYEPVRPTPKQSKAGQIEAHEADDDHHSAHSEYSEDYSDNEEHGHYSGDELGPPPGFKDLEHESRGRRRERSASPSHQPEESRSRSPTPELNTKVTELPDVTELSPAERMARAAERGRQEMERSMQQFRQGKLHD